MKSWEKIQPVQFGSYKLVERLAMGGMAEVYLARPDDQPRLVALKRILPQIAADEDFVAMFIDEAKIAGQLNHPAVAQIYDLGKIDKSYFIAMEYVSGHDLRVLWDRVRDAGELGRPSMTLALACHVVRKICEGLDFAHRSKDSRGRPLGIIHRDVSPENVLVSYDGDLKIIDFGVAKASGRLSKTQTGILKGKFAYMSPEQARGDLIDHRADIFAIGVILYELVTGERAFRAESDFGLLEKVRRVDVVPARALRPEIPRELERILLKALAREPGDRYPWASALAADLDRLMADQGWTSSREDLAAFIQRAFRAEFDDERNRLASYRAYFNDDEQQASTNPLRGGARSTSPRGFSTSSEDVVDAIDDAPGASELIELRAQARRIAREGVSVGAEEQELIEATDDGEVPTRDPGRARARDSLRSRDRARDVAMPSSPFGMFLDDELSLTHSIPSLVGEASLGLPRPPADTTQVDKVPSREAEEPEEPDITMPSKLSPSSRAELEPGGPARLHRDDGRGPGPESASRSARGRAADFEGEAGEPTSAPSSRHARRHALLAAGLSLLVGGAAGTWLSPWAERGRPVIFVTTPRQAEVRLGDIVLCLQTPCVASLAEGHHEIRFHAAGADPLFRTVEVTDGSAEGMPGAPEAVVEVALERPVEGVRLETVPPGARVTLDGRPLEGVTPLTLPVLLSDATVRLKFQLEGFEPLEVSRTVGDEPAPWRYDLPTSTTTWTVVAEPADTFIEGPGRARGGRHTVTVGKRSAVLKFRRPGCSDREVMLQAVGRAEAEQKVVLDCRPLDSALFVAAKRRPLVKIDGVEVSRAATLQPYPLPTGTWTVLLRGTRGKAESHTVELRAGETTRIVMKAR